MGRLPVRVACDDTVLKRGRPTLIVAVPIMFVPTAPLAHNTPFLPLFPKTGLARLLVREALAVAKFK